MKSGLYSKKDLIVFDLDGTLTPSKSPMHEDVGRLLGQLLIKKKVAIIGGGTYEQFEKQFVAHIKGSSALLANLFLFPTTSTSFYKYDGKKWKEIYRKVLTASEKKKILSAFATAFKKINYVTPKKVWGKIIEDRDSQITFSALGQKAPVSAKEKWNKKQDVRPHIMKVMQSMLPQLEVKRGGLTSIDVTKKGIDKGYGILQIKKVLKIPVQKMLFVGDALYPGGNDHAARRTGIQCISVRGPEDTKKIILKAIKD